MYLFCAESGRGKESVTKNFVVWKVFGKDWTGVRKKNESREEKKNKSSKIEAKWQAIE